MVVEKIKIDDIKCRYTYGHTAPELYDIENNQKDLNIKINNINIIIPTIIPTLGITDSDIKEKSRDIVNASIVTIRGQLFLFFFFSV